MKRLMILGASYSQLPLIDAAKKAGIYTIVASTPGSWPGFQAADDFTYTDISNPEDVLKAAEKFQIDGITSCCLDTGVPAIGFVSEKMGLCGPSKEAACITTNKYRMKEAFLKGGVSCAVHKKVKNREELEEALLHLKLPIVTKAVDLMGSRGIYRCNTKEEVYDNYEKTMKDTGMDYCLVEEFIEGTLFGVEAMVKDGEVVFCLPDNTEAYAGYVPTPVGHSVPFEKEEQLGIQVREQLRKAVKAVGLDNCAVNSDMIYKDGRVYVIEITGRAGATCLPEIVGIYYGINYYEAMVRLALGMEVASMFQNPTGKSCIARTLLSDKSGIVKKIENNNTSASDIVDLQFNIAPGDAVRKYENGRDRIGQVIIKEDILPDCNKRLEEVLSKIKIEFVE